MREITSELETLTPPLFRNGGTSQQLLAALDTTIPTVNSFARLGQLIAAMNDADAARAALRSFVPIFEHYDNPRGWGGTYKEEDFDYWRFIGHELLVSLIAPLLTEERYEIINDLLDEPLTVNNARYNEGKPVDYTYASEWLRSFEPLNQEHRKISFHGHILQQRHEGPLADVLPLEQFCAADYLLYLRGELRTPELDEREYAWIPWSGVYLRATPPFIHSATRIAIAQRLATTLGTPDVATLKTRLNERASKFSRLWSRGLGYYQQPLTNEQIMSIGTR
jgi:hypothetical protein